MHNINTLSSLFQPSSIAILGASNNKDKMGFTIIKNLLLERYMGKIYPIHPSAEKIQDLQTFSKVSEIPLSESGLDLAIVCLPSDLAEESLHELARIQCKSVFFPGNGFRDVGGVGTIKEERLKQIATEYDINLLGPNSLGFFSATNNINASLLSSSPLAGSVGFFSHSVAFCVTMADWAKKQGIGFSQFVSLGNKALLDETDMLLYLADDPQTKVIVAYLEYIKDGQSFLHNAHAVTRKKPVVLLKGGLSQAGARAVSAQKGIIAGEEAVFNAACKQTGIIRARYLKDFFTMTEAFAKHKPVKGPSVAIVSNAGSPSILASDACEENKLTIASFSEETAKKIQEALPAHGSFYNPIRTEKGLTLETLQCLLNALLQDPNVHMILLLLTPHPDAHIQQLIELAIEKNMHSEKEIFICLMSSDFDNIATSILEKNNILLYSFPETAVKAMETLYKQSEWEKTPFPVAIHYRKNMSKAREIVEKSRKSGEYVLDHEQSFLIAKMYEIPVLDIKVARTSEEACIYAKQLGFPVALKITKPKNEHKNNVQVAALNLDSKEKVQQAFIDMTNKANALSQNSYISSCIVQSMAPSNSHEVFISCKRDPSFGPFITFGLGSSDKATTKTTSCRLAPLSLDDVYTMIHEIKAISLLLGKEEQLGLRFTAIEDLLLIISQLSLDIPDIEEIDCRQIFINETDLHLGDITIYLTNA